MVGNRDIGKNYYVNAIVYTSKIRKKLSIFKT